MIIKHNGKTPQIHPTAYVAPTATVCGDVTIGPNCRIMHGASIIAEGGSISFGEYCIVLENAVVRSTGRHSASIGNFCLIGPNAHVTGCTVENEIFIATGAAIFHGAHLGKGAEVRINGVVHLKSHLLPGEMVPIGWVAVGNPAKIFPPHEHEKIWELQKPLNFPLAVYGIERGEGIMPDVTRKIAKSLATHKHDEINENEKN